MLINNVQANTIIAENNKEEFNIRGFLKSTILYFAVKLAFWRDAECIRDKTRRRVPRRKAESWESKHEKD